MLKRNRVLLGDEEDIFTCNTLDELKATCTCYGIHIGKNVTIRKHAMFDFIKIRSHATIHDDVIITGGATVNRCEIIPPGTLVDNNFGADGHNIKMGTIVHNGSAHLPPYNQMGIPHPPNSPYYPTQLRDYLPDELCNQYEEQTRTPMDVVFQKITIANVNQILKPLVADSVKKILEYTAKTDNEITVVMIPHNSFLLTGKDFNIVISPTSNELILPVLKDDDDELVHNCIHQLHKIVQFLQRYNERVNILDDASSVITAGFIEILSDLGYTQICVEYNKIENERYISITYDIENRTKALIFSVDDPDDYICESKVLRDILLPGIVTLKKKKTK